MIILNEELSRQEAYEKLKAMSVPKLLRLYARYFPEDYDDTKSRYEMADDLVQFRNRIFKTSN